MLQKSENRIAIRTRTELKEARDESEDWTGKADSKERRKVQNRLHQRAWRRRKAVEIAEVRSRYLGAEHGSSRIEDNRLASAFAEATTALIPNSLNRRGPAPTAMATIPLYATAALGPAHIHDLMTQNLSSMAPIDMFTRPASAPPNRRSLAVTRPSSAPTLIPPVIGYLKRDAPPSSAPPFRFPLSPDHYLITLIQYNVFRASLTNIALCSQLDLIPPECRGALQIPLLPRPSQAPPVFAQTPTQMAIPHMPWIDTLPCPNLRDNLIKSLGAWDEDEWCNDICGGLWEGYDHAEQTGILVWGEPWLLASWEISEGFAKKWEWLLKGCKEFLESTNKWREQRGEDPLVWEVE